MKAPHLEQNDQGDDGEVPRLDTRRPMSIAEAAAPLGITERSAYRQIRAGTFPVRTIRIGTFLKVRPGDLERFLSGDIDNEAAAV